MNNLHVASGVAVNAASVVLEGLGNCNSSGDWSALVDFLHHVFFARNSAEFVDTIDVVGIGDEAGLSGRAVSAHIHGRALLAIVVTTSSVDRAGLVGDFVEVHPLESVVSFTTVAAIVFHFAGDEHLRGNVDVGPGSITGDLDAIGEG